MQTLPRTAGWIGWLAVLGLLVACSPTDESSTTAAPTVTTSDQCAKDSLHLLKPGRLTIATSDPAFAPWVLDNDPTSGKGYESAVAYAVADQLGFSKGEVTWVAEPFNKSYAPGAKDFDFDINQISITPKREQVVDFSEGYISTAQAVLTLKSSPFADAKSLTDLADARLGAQVGTTSLQAITDIVKPSQDPLVYQSTNDAKSALQNDQSDGIVVDLPTAFYIRDAQIPGSTIVGQFEPTNGVNDELGLLFEQGNPLVACVNQALTALRSSGTLDQLEQRWLSQVASVPTLS